MDFILCLENEHPLILKSSLKVLLNSCLGALLFQGEVFHRSFLYKKSKELFNYFINLDYIEKILLVCSKTLQL